MSLKLLTAQGAGISVLFARCELILSFPCFSDADVSMSMASSCAEKLMSLLDLSCGAYTALFEQIFRDVQLFLSLTRILLCSLHFDSSSSMQSLGDKIGILLMKSFYACYLNKP